ncbi:Signal peptidase I [Halanaeroarchaeum sp. HSR-CO]|uniref:S26 family signal peptidase n=1 Tax=Halanaeroarchaeum sp. HSR-CO TaxID=2866382 RepID=UPI00217E2DEE|nr:S26 family signal peptidase [Halanaeroarchaeum sp. HSR-CO]UWG46454.1 Signal peptidase I [Halanaeroarchaeum sp. HSR-CO]
MDARRLVWNGLEVLVIVLVAGLVVGQVLGTPILFGYVETGSMAPTMEAGDGFVAVPAALAGSPETGDVVTFRAEKLHEGGLTTHRIVGTTDRGYLTQGDANPFTDQDGDEPPVKDAQIVAVALQVGGQTVVLPHLGTGVTAVQGAFEAVQRQVVALTGMRSLAGGQGLAYVVLGLSIALYLVDLLLSRGPSRERDRTVGHDDGVDGRLIVVGLAAMLVLSATAAMVAPAGAQSIGVVSAEFESERPTVIPTGESKTLDYRIPNGGLVPVHVYLEPGSEGVAVDPGHQYVGGRSAGTAAVTLTAPEETGYYQNYLVEHRYLAVLPASLIDGLYRVHPWAPILAIDAVLAGVILGLGFAALGGQRVRLRRRKSRHSRSVGRRLLAFLTPSGDRRESNS